MTDIKELGYTVETEIVSRNGRRYARYHLITSPVQMEAFR